MLHSADTNCVAGDRPECTADLPRDRADWLFRTGDGTFESALSNEDWRRSTRGQAFPTADLTKSNPAALLLAHGQPPGHRRGGADH